MSCVACELEVTSFKRRTAEIATEAEFFCPMCNLSETAAALWSDYVVEYMETKEPESRQCIDYYKLNWRLIMAAELLGESQVGGSIIVGLMLDLTTVAFRNKWTPMELQLRAEQVRIGKIIVA
jgi:hypothetical protein